jgi:hypothetical protein
LHLELSNIRNVQKAVLCASKIFQHKNLGFASGTFKHQERPKKLFFVQAKYFNIRNQDLHLEVPNIRITSSIQILNIFSKLGMIYSRGKFDVKILILINFGSHEHFEQNDCYRDLNWITSKLIGF